LKKSLGSIEEVGKIDLSTIMAAVTSHEGAPYSVCRHAAGEAMGSTLGLAVYEAPGEGDGPDVMAKLRFYRNQPCLDRFKDWTV